MKITRLSADFALAASASQRNEGEFQGVAAVFNNLKQAPELDILVPNCFARTLKSWGEKRIPLLWQHDTNEVIGSFKAHESARGLEVDGRITMTARGADAYKLLKAGDVTGLSIGFTADRGAIEIKKNPDGSVYRYLKQVRLYEASLVAWPADHFAEVETVHSEISSTAVWKRQNPNDMSEQDWMAMKIKLLMDEGKSQEQAVAEAQAMWDSMMQSQHSLIYVAENLDVANPDSVHSMVTYFQRLLPDVSTSGTQAEQHQEPQQSTSDAQPPTAAPDFEARAAADLAEVLSALRKE